MHNKAFFGVLVYSRFGPNWQETVEILAHISNLNLATFVDKTIFTQKLYVFEVMGESEDIELFERALKREDRRGEIILYSHWNNLGALA